MAIRACLAMCLQLACEPYKSPLLQWAFCSWANTWYKITILWSKWFTGTSWTLSHHIWIFFVQHVPVHHLLSSLAILYHLITQLQKVHCLLCWSLQITALATIFVICLLCWSLQITTLATIFAICLLCWSLQITALANISAICFLCWSFWIITLLPYFAHSAPTPVRNQAMVDIVLGKFLHWCVTVEVWGWIDKLFMYANQGHPNWF